MATESPAGATPAAEGATPPQTPAPPAPGPEEPAAPPATGDEAALGEGGKRALQAERERAKAAERKSEELQARLEELENASKSDQEKALAQARKEGETEAQGRYEALIRRTRVESALVAAGVADSPAGVATFLAEHPGLKVTEEGDVDGLADALETFRTAHPALFAPATPPPPPPASADGGARGSGGAQTFTREQLRDPEFYHANEEAIRQAAREGRISG